MICIVHLAGSEDPDAPILRIDALNWFLLLLHESFLAAFEG